MREHCNHQARGARKGEFGSPLVAEQDWPSGVGDEEKKVGSHAPRDDSGWLAGGRRKRVGGVLVCNLSLPFDGSVCRVLLLAKGLFSFVRAPCCRPRGSPSPYAAPLISPAHAAGSVALFPAGSGARLAARKFGVLWGRMAPKKRRSPPLWEEAPRRRGRGALAPAPDIPFRLVGRWWVVPFLWGLGGCSGRFAPSGGARCHRPPPPPPLRKKGGKKKKGSCVLCGVPRRALWGGFAAGVVPWPLSPAVCVSFGLVVGVCWVAFLARRIRLSAAAVICGASPSASHIPIAGALPQDAIGHRGGAGETDATHPARRWI